MLAAGQRDTASRLMVHELRQVVSPTSVVASFDSTQLTLDLLRHKPQHHCKGEEAAQENEVHQQRSWQRGLFRHLGT